MDVCIRLQLESLAERERESEYERERASQIALFL